MGRKPVSPRRRAGADEIFVGDYLKRNREALNASVDRALADQARGDSFTRDQVLEEVKANRQRRRRRTK